MATAGYTKIKGKSSPKGWREDVIVPKQSLEKTFSFIFWERERAQSRTGFITKIHLAQLSFPLWLLKAFGCHLLLQEFFYGLDIRSLIRMSPLAGAALGVSLLFPAQVSCEWNTSEIYNDSLKKKTKQKKEHSGCENVCVQEKFFKSSSSLMLQKLALVANKNEG